MSVHRMPLVASSSMSAGARKPAGSNGSPRYRGRGQSPLAALPDPAAQALAAAEGDARARAVLATAAAAGAPLVNPDGRARAHITLPEYRRGRAPANKGKRYPVEVLTFEEVQAIMDALPKGGPVGARNRALIAVMWRSGLRVAEALALFPKDVDAARGTLTILLGKGAKRRVVGIDRGALGYVDAWIGMRTKLGLGADAPLFCTVSNDAGGLGRPLGSPSVRVMLKRTARKAGIIKRVHPHGLRHTHAFELSNEDIPVHVIKAQLGHENLEMTQRYIDHLTPKQLIHRLSARTWPGQPPEPQTTIALSQGQPAPSRSEPIPGHAISWEPREPESLERPQPAKHGEGSRRVFEVIVANGGAATQAQIRRALGLSCPTVLHHLHALQSTGKITRAGLDRNRSIIWKVAPPPAQLRRITDRPHRCALNGEGATRVLDALEALDGRASQAQLAQMLSLATQTISDHCHELEAEGQIVRGGLDKSTSRRGSQVWRLRPAEVHWGAGGHSPRLRVANRSSGATATTT